MFKNATHGFSLVRSYFIYTNMDVVSIQADTVILSRPMSCLSDHPLQTTLPLGPPPPPPIPFPETCPITVTVIATAWVIPQCVRAGDTKPDPPRCVLWQHHASTATVDDVRMPPRGGHQPLSLSLCLSPSVTLTPRDAGMRKEKSVKMRGDEHYRIFWKNTKQFVSWFMLWATD